MRNLCNIINSAHSSIQLLSIGASGVIQTGEVNTNILYELNRKKSTS